MTLDKLFVIFSAEVLWASHTSNNDQGDSIPSIAEAYNIIPLSDLAASHEFSF